MHGNIYKASQLLPRSPFRIWNDCWLLGKLIFQMQLSAGTAGQENYDELRVVCIIFVPSFASCQIYYCHTFCRATFCELSTNSPSRVRFFLLDSIDSFDALIESQRWCFTLIKSAPRKHTGVPLSHVASSPLCEKLTVKIALSGASSNVKANVTTLR